MCDLEMIAAMLMFSVIGATAGGLGYLAFRKAVCIVIMTNKEFTKLL